MDRPRARDDRYIGNMVRLSHASVDNDNSLVIVALPSEDDLVQKVSSEKAAHMTLLYLGKPNFDQSQIDLIADFVEHAASTLSPFMLEVERRGVLGSDDADVLFFVKKYAKRIGMFRNQLLQNDLISGAYNSIEQYPEWTPHLTLGYPASPAKKFPDGYDGKIYGVDFDRIALWTGDSIGPTFQLLRNDNDLEVAMSQIQRGRAFVMGESISHHGVKGMRWGVRKDGSGSSGASSNSTRKPARKTASKSAPKPRMSEDAKAAEKVFGKINRGGTDAVSNHELQSLVTRLNLEQQYSRLTTSPKRASAMKRGHESVKEALSYAKTYNDIKKLLDSDAGNLFKKGFKAAAAGATVGAAAYTGGASAAAATGASLVIRRMANHYTNVGN